MKCIYCLHKRTEVINSREAKGGTMTWRRRSCLSCEETFTTKESAFADNLFVIKRNGTRQRFTYEKIFISIFTALNTKKKSDNGDNAKTAKKISEVIIKKILALPGTKTHKNIATSKLTCLVFAELKKISQSFADYYVYYSDYRLEVARKERLI